MQRRIRWRVTLPYLILLAVAVIALTLISVDHIRQQKQSRCLARLTDTAQQLALAAQEYAGMPGGESQLTSLAQITSAQTGFSIILINSDGRVLGSSLAVEQLPSDLLALPAIKEARTDGLGTHTTVKSLSAAVPISNQDNSIAGFVYVQASAENAQSDVTQLFAWAALIILTGSLGILFISLIIRDRSRQSIEKLAITAQQMSMGNFTNLEFPETSNELKDLSQALQNMAQQLGGQIDALTAERAKLSAILNQMTDGVLIADEDGRVQLLNHAAERLFESDMEASTGRSVVEVLRYHQLVELWRVAKDGQRQSTMLEIGPQHLFLQVIGIPLKSSLPGSTMILFQDLTQLRRLETVRRDFISNVSHELRTPLASLKALAETLQEGALEDPPAARRFISRMETEIDNLTQLVNELLELSRIESGKVPLSFNRIQPCELLKPPYERMVLQAERAGLELILDCTPDLPAVFADPDRISQVLINLVHNAIKFTPPGGKITTSAYADGDHIVFFVRDTGVGIDRKDLGRIFERFYKADRARTGGGTGLGLSIARHMIESHGGYIWAESEEGVGSTFYFTLPIA